MRVLLLRIGALGVMVVLGWIAIAHAQRGNSGLATGDSPADNRTVVAEDSAPPMAMPPRSDRNPLRTPAPPSASPTQPPAADPFGLQTQRGGGATALPASPPPVRDSIPDAAALGLPPPRASVADSSRYPQLAAATVPAEQPLPGPSLIPSDPGRSANDRYATRPTPPDRTASRVGQRYGTPAAGESQEPAPFKADPFALPANPNHKPTADRGFGLSADSSRVVETAADVDGSGQPGGPQLEGAQSPQLTIQKSAPKEIQVGKPALFRVTVRNTGQIPACEVEICDLVPKGTRLLGTMPRTDRGARGEIVWKLGTIRPGEESTVEMQLMPISEGEIGSVATVHFGADASARSIATRPKLVIESAAPNKVLIGDPLTLTITISNPGTGVATGVVLEERIPPGLQHPAGSELEYEVGNLKPGESRKLELAMVANRPGPVTNLLSARGDGSLHAESKLSLEVLAPQLDVTMEGPKRRYLERQATYQLSVTNPGTAPAKHVQLIASLPPGLRFVSANNAGHYEEATRTVHWRLEELPANETGSVELVTMPVEAGQHAIRLHGAAEKGLMVDKEQPVIVEGIAAILFQVADTVDPVEVGGETTYEARVVNRGSKAAANVRLAIQLPAEVQALAAEGPTRYALDGNHVLFDGLALLAPKAETIYRVRVKALKPGDLRARFQLLTDEMQGPVTKEESTRVYADE